MAILLILIMASFILTILYLYRKKQITYQNNLQEIRTDYEKNLLKTQLEIQEQTVQNISREIHDNINLSLTLAKLNLNTFNLGQGSTNDEKITASIELISKAITELSDISRSLSSEIMAEQGMLKALENDMIKLKKLGWYNLEFEVTGNLIFLDAQKELLIYRIIQESLNNILKHSKATIISLKLFYNNSNLEIKIRDNGIGFLIPGLLNGSQKSITSGLRNMKNRAELVNGTFKIDSAPGDGTLVQISIPY